MKILIAGGAGYVGAALVPALISHGHQVTVVDLLWFGNRLPAGVTVIQKDILALAVDDLKGYDQVLFLGGLSNDPMADFSPATNFVMNGASPAYLAYAAKRAGVTRFVYASSCSVYGYTTNQLYDEEAPTISNYPYGISKLQGERAVMGLADETFSVISLRKGTISGHSPRMRFDLVVNAMFRSACLDGKIRVNNPSIWRPILSLKDAVSSYLRAVECDASVTGVFNAASLNITIGELADLVHDRLREKAGMSVALETLNVHDLRNYKVNCNRARDIIGFAPRQSVEDIVDNLLAHRESYGDFSDPSFYNIQTFKQLAL